MDRLIEMQHEDTVYSRYCENGPMGHPLQLFVQRLYKIFQSYAHIYLMLDVKLVKVANVSRALY